MRKKTVIISLVMCIIIAILITVLVLLLKSDDESPPSTSPPTQAVTSPPPTQAVTSPPPTQAVTSPPPTQAVTSPPPTQGVTSPPPTQGVTSPPPTITCVLNSDCDNGTCVCEDFDSNGNCVEGLCRDNECDTCTEGEQCIAGKCFAENESCGEEWWYLPNAAKNAEVSGYKNRAPSLCTTTGKCWAKVDTSVTPRCAVCTEDSHCPDGEVCYTQDNSSCYDWITPENNYHNNTYSFCAKPQCSVDSDCDGSLGEGINENAKKNKPDSKYCQSPGTPCGCAVCDPRKENRISESGYLVRSPGCEKIEVVNEEDSGNYGNYCINNICKIGECQDETDCIGSNMVCNSETLPNSFCSKGDIDSDKTWSTCLTSDSGCEKIYMEAGQNDEFYNRLNEIDTLCYGEIDVEAGDICAGPGYGAQSKNVAMLFSGLNQTHINNLFIRDDSPCAKCHADTGGYPPLI